MFKVVFIDDQDNYDSILADIAVELGFELFIARNASGGIKIIKEENPSLIICDGLNGMCWFVQKEADEIPFILFSSEKPAAEKISSMYGFWEKGEVFAGTMISDIRNVISANSEGKVKPV